ARVRARLPHAAQELPREPARRPRRARGQRGAAAPGRRRPARLTTSDDAPHPPVVWRVVRCTRAVYSRVTLTVPEERMAIDDPRGSLRMPAVPDTEALVAAVDTFPVRDGEEPWSLEEIEALAAELTAEATRLRGELLAADAELS